MNTSKEETQWRQGFQAVKPETKLVPKKPRKKRTPRVKKLGNIAEVSKMGRTTKVEQKALIQEQKQMLKRAWSSTNDESDKEANDEQDLPSNFKTYTIEDRKIKLLKPKREKPITMGQSWIDWEHKLSSALWAYRIAYKTAVGATPFELVYGLNAILPIEFLVPTL